MPSRDWNWMRCSAEIQYSCAMNKPVRIWNVLWWLVRWNAKLFWASDSRQEWTQEWTLLPHWLYALDEGSSSFLAQSKCSKDLKCFIGVYRETFATRIIQQIPEDFEIRLQNNFFLLVFQTMYRLAPVKIPILWATIIA